MGVGRDVRGWVSYYLLFSNALPISRRFEITIAVLVVGGKTGREDTGLRVKHYTVPGYHMYL